MDRYVPPKKTTFSIWGPGPPCNTWYLGPTRVIIQNGISIGSAVFVWVINVVLYSVLLMGKKTPKSFPSPWDFVTPSEEDRATAMDNTRKKLAKIAHVVLEICSLTDTQTDRQTHTHTHTHVLITILRHCSRGRSKYLDIQMKSWWTECTK